MAVKVAKYLLRMYLSNIVNIYKSLRLKFKNLKFKQLQNHDTSFIL
jgi:hypothetical protein